MPATAGGRSIVPTRRVGRPANRPASGVGRAHRRTAIASGAPIHLRRVQQWRQEHPGYGRRPSQKSRRTLQETCLVQPPGAAAVAPEAWPEPSRPALQDLCRVPTPLRVGLIAQCSDTALPEDIVTFTRLLPAPGAECHFSANPRPEITSGFGIYRCRRKVGSGGWEL